jgi:ATP/maltotriose-dependent transcriptional regulator MalT
MILSPRLRTLMDAALQYRITEIVAPAGFGKSTIIDYLARARDFAIASVRPGKEAALALMAALCEAVATQAPELQLALPAAYANASSSNTISKLATWFLEGLPDNRQAIAIDDLHYLGDDIAGWRLLCDLVELSGSAAKWVLAARTWLNVPTVDWIACGMQAPPIVEKTLACRSDDIRFIAESLEVPFSEQLIERICEATHGWPLLVAYGLRLFSSDPSSLSEALLSRGVDAIVERLLSRLETEDLRLLIAVALYDGVRPELLERTHLGGHRALKRLAAEGIPLTESYDRCWRLHDAIRARLFEKKQIETVAESERLCAALEALKFLDRALEVATSGNALEAARALLERHVSHFMFASNPQLVRRALGLFSRHAIDQSGDLALIRGHLEMKLGHSAIGIAFLRRAVECSDGDKRSYALTRLGFGLMNWQGHASEGLEVLHQAAMRPVCENADDACEVLGGTAVGLALGGKIHSALTQADCAIKLLPQLKDSLIEARAYFRAGQVAFLASRFEQAEVYFQRSAHISEEHGFVDVLLMAYDSLKNVIAREKEALAIEYARRAASYAARTLDEAMLYLERSSLFVYACRCGNIAEAEEHKRYLYPIPEQRRPRFEAIVLVMAAHLSMLQGDLERASDFLLCVRSFGEPAMNPELMPLREALYYSYTSVLNQLRAVPDEPVRDAKRSLSLINSAPLVGIALSALPDVELAKICCAAIFGINGRISEAQPILDDMAANAHELYRRDLARWVSELIADPSAEPSPEARTRANGIITLLQRCAAGIEIPSLTPAERRVLEALAEGRSTKEIAAATGRSSKTVNNTVSSILRKLNARSRGEAVARARRRGLLDEEREPTPV